MKKVKKSLSPQGLIDFVSINPKGTWNEFRDANQGLSYNQLRQLAVEDQGHLCAYCETKTSRFSIEHFHPKSDISNPNKNWALDWSNLLAVCRGGREGNKELYPTPKNLSCDAYKDYLNKHGKILNPLEISIELLFEFNKGTGELIVNKDLAPNLVLLAQETQQVLNLNCYRLCMARLEVLKAYNQQIAQARKLKNKAIFKQLAKRWFSKTWPSFFTTRRSLLGKHAESYLAQINYQG